jgi:hypothetical protein
MTGGTLARSTSQLPSTMTLAVVLFSADGGATSNGELPGTDSSSCGVRMEFPGAIEKTADRREHH